MGNLSFFIKCNKFYYNEEKVNRWGFFNWNSPVIAGKDFLRASNSKPW